MALTNVELYEALKGSVGEEAARMIAEVVPPASDLATKHDLLATKSDLEREIGAVRLEIGAVRLEIADVRTEMREGFGLLRSEIHALGERMSNRMLTMFIPLWLGVFGLIATLIVKG
jgi:hypothetical protein